MSDTNKSKIPPVSEAYGGGDGPSGGMFPPNVYSLPNEYVAENVAAPAEKSTEEQAPTEEAIVKPSVEAQRNNGPSGEGQDYPGSSNPQNWGHL
jgi:hypothetical protein